MDKLQIVKTYFENYIIENNISVDSIVFEKLIDILYHETIEHFNDYQSFYDFFTNDF